MIDRRHVWVFVIKSRQKQHRYNQVAGGGVLEAKVDALSR